LECIDGKDHTLVAVVALFAEHPNRFGVLLNFNGQDGDFFSTSGNWHETGVHANFTGSLVTQARARFFEGRLREGVILVKEGEVDLIANLSRDLVRVEYERIFSVLVLSNHNAELFGGYKGSKREENSSGEELHD
jgi:hypothetical protein